MIHTKNSKLWPQAARTFSLVSQCGRDVKHWSRTESSSVKPHLLSVLKGDDGVDFVHVVRAVPENSSEVICVGRVVHLYLMTEASMFGEGVNLSFVKHSLHRRTGCSS